MSEAIPSRSMRSPARFRFAIRLRTMLLIVLAVAAALGYRDYRKRRSAVDYLLSRVPVSVYMRSRPTFPDRDSTYDPGGTFAVAIRRVRELRVEETAIAELVVALREARGSGDEQSMRGALAALQGLGPSIKAAGPEVARVVGGEGLPVGRLGEYSDVRALGVHVLAMIAREDEDFLPTLIAALSLPDPSPDKMLTASAANELAPFGPEARGAVPAILAMMDARAERRAGRDGAATGSPDLTNFARLESILAAIGPAASPALPRLIALARDRSEDDDSRTAAISAVVGILWPRVSDGVMPKELVALLEDLSGDDAAGVRAYAIQHLRQVESFAEMTRRRDAIRLLIAEDRVRGGRPRPRIATPNP